MANRFRNSRIEIKLTKEEKEIFEKKMKLTNCKTMSHFLRKCVLEKEIYIVDLEPFRNLQWLLSNVTNNINQVAKATNITGFKELTMQGYQIKSKSFSEIMDNYFQEWIPVRSSKTKRISQSGVSIPVKLYYEKKEENKTDFIEVDKKFLPEEWKKEFN